MVSALMRNRRKSIPHSAFRIHTSSVHAFILAGGFATRLWPLTESRPKPLLPLAGKPILTHLVRSIPPEIAITVSTNAAFADAFHQWKLQSDDLRPTPHAPIDILIEDTRSDDRKLGALGAVAQWINHTNIEDDVLLLTGDNYCGFAFDPFFAFIQHSSQSPVIIAHDIHERSLARAFGTVVLEDPRGKTLTAIEGGRVEKVQSFEEKPAEPKSTYISTGVSYIPKSHLRVLVEFAEKHPDNVGGIFEEFLRRGIDVCAYIPEEGQWFDIGSFESYIEATRVLVQGLKKDPSSQVDDPGKCIGSVVIGKNCRIQNSTLENVVLFDHCIIENSDLRDCICDDGCVIDGIDLRGKMLRKNTHLVRGH